MERVGPAEIRQILAVTDALQIHREGVRVPLLARAGGSVRVTAADQLEIVVPADQDFATWMTGLSAQIRGLDLSRLRRTA